jgi:serine phosphatase RsbU (regulator of sigma subunit)
MTEKTTPKDNAASGSENMALHYFERARVLAEELKAKDLLYQAHEAFAEEYERLGDIEKAYHHFKAFHRIEREVFNEESDKRTKNLQIIHQVEQTKRETEIERLKNVELAEANRNITASIDYAQKIQQAILPTSEKMTATLGEHLVLYKPKDIVSGDFYWVHQSGTVLFVAVCDCTGHGVPGAFMSMIASSLLNQVLIQKQIHEPHQALTELASDLRHALGQSGKSDLQDSIDMCLIKINGAHLEFAGARRPLYIVRQHNLIELKGNRQSVGGRLRENETDFVKHTLMLETDDMLYLTTDGFADQANAKRETFGSRRLKELLIDIAAEPLEKQHETLIQTLELHRQTETQRDDITLLGLRKS